MLIQKHIEVLSVRMTLEGASKTSARDRGRCPGRRASRGKRVYRAVSGPAEGAWEVGGSRRADGCDASGSVTAAAGARVSGRLYAAVRLPGCDLVNRARFAGRPPQPGAGAPRVSFSAWR